MATIAEERPVATSAGKARPKFYLWVGIATCVAMFIGFYQSFYLNHWFATPPGMRKLSPLFLVHGTIFSLWLVFAVLQPALIVSKNRALHKKVGWFAACVAIAMLIIGNVASSEAMNHGFAGVGDPKVFYAVPFFDLVVFGLCVGLGVHWRNHSDTHKRLMLLSYTQLLHAGIGRYNIALNQALAPWSFLLGADSAIIIAGGVYDLATRGKIHKVWWLGGALVLASEPLRLAIGNTAPWHEFASWVASLWPS
ncbi:MAG TPA: hypothetical protein VF067_07370 [Sphingomicrobium sp.]